MVTRQHQHHYCQLALALGLTLIVCLMPTVAQENVIGRATVERLSEQNRITLPAGDIIRPLLNHDGSQLATYYTLQNVLDVYDTASGERLYRIETSGRDFAFNADGTYLMGVTDTAITIWNADTGLLHDRIVARDDTALVGAHWHPSQPALMAYIVLDSMNAQGEPLMGETVRLYDVNDKAIVNTLAHATVSSALFSPDGRALASSGRDGSVLWWNLSDINAPRPVPVMASVDVEWVNPYQTYLHFSRDGQWLHYAPGVRDADMVVWSVRERRLTPVPNILRFGRPGLFTYATDLHTRLVYTFAMGETNSIGQLWDVTTGANLAILTEEAVQITDIISSADDTLIFIPARGRILVRDVQTGAVLTTIAATGRMDISDDGSTLVVVRAGGDTAPSTAFVWALSS